MDDFDYVPGMFLNSSAAPKIEKYPEQKPEKQVKEEVRERVSTVSIKAVLAFIGVLAVIITMLSTVIYLNEKIIANQKDITKYTNQVKQANAENVRLTAELSSIISADKIQNYAVTVLGMQQAERYQIHYFEDRDGDKVVVAAGKIPNADT